jgi:hypothetical protein
MTKEEAIKYLLAEEVDFLATEVEQHEEFAEEETGEMQIEMYKDNLKRLEAFQVIFGALDPSIDSIEALKEKAHEANEEVYGSEESTEPSEEEKELVEVLKSWEKTRTDIKKGYAWSLGLPEEYNKILAKINLEDGKARKVIGDDDDDEPEELSEDDEFTFYYYRNEVCVVYNDYADGSFSSYPKSFQKKALELIKSAIGEGKAYLAG